MKRKINKSDDWIFNFFLCFVVFVCLCVCEKIETISYHSLFPQIEKLYVSACSIQKRQLKKQNLEPFLKRFGMCYFATFFFFRIFVYFEQKYI